jgi:glutathione S-transferase
MKLVFDTVVQKSPWIVRPIVNKIREEVTKSFIGPNLRNNFAYMEAEVGTTGWFAGDKFSGADIIMSYPVKNAFMAKIIDEKSHPNLAKYIQNIGALPCYQKAVQIGGTLDL